MTNYSAIDTLKKKGKIVYLSKLKMGVLKKKNEKTRRKIGIFHIKTGKELTDLYNYLHVGLSVDVFEKIVKVSAEQFGVYPLNCLSVPDFSWDYELEDTGIVLGRTQVVHLVRLIETNVWLGISPVMSFGILKPMMKLRFCI